MPILSGQIPLCGVSHLDARAERAFAIWRESQHSTFRVNQVRPFEFVEAGLPLLAVADALGLDGRGHDPIQQDQVAPVEHLEKVEPRVFACLADLERDGRHDRQPDDAPVEPESDETQALPEDVGRFLDTGKWLAQLVRDLFRWDLPSVTLQ